MGHILITIPHLLVCMIIGVDMVVKFLVFLILLITEFTVKVGSKVFQRFGNGLLFVNIILQEPQNKTNKQKKMNLVNVIKKQSY